VKRAEPLLAAPAPPAAGINAPAGLLRRWAGILSAYLSTQVLTQLAGIGSGLLLVRFMPVGEFALYTLATSVITFFIFLCDLGSTSSLLYFFQRAAKGGEAFAPYLKAVLSLRRLAFLLGVAGVVLLFPRSASAKGFASRDITLVTVGIVLAVWFQITSSVRVLALRLEGRYGRSYRAELAGGGLRLLLAGAMVVTALLHAWIAMLSTALATALVAFLAAPTSPETATTPETATKAGIDGIGGIGAHRRQVLRYLLPTLPSALYFSVQGPLVIWLAATFGVERNIAEVGALGRLGLAVGLFSGLTGMVFLPRMARIVDDRLYRRRYLQFGAALAGIALALFAAAYLVPGLFLMILGPHYAGLHAELLLVVAGSGVTLLGGYSVAVNLARSWNRFEWVSVVTVILAQAVLVATLPLKSTAGVLLFNLLSATVGLAAQLVITALGFWRPRLVQWMR
jgi:O-antigen/teichoic acid export membrane protein